MDGLAEKVVTIAVAITGVAMLALIVSKQANTAGVITAGGDSFSKALATALSPVTGSGSGVSLNGFTPQF
jgi:hypothetical protein